MVIALEGLPGSGKTTATALVAARLGAAALKETTGDHPFLAQVYEDHYRDDLTVELAFLVVHANPYRLLDRSRLNVCDFSPVKDLLFADDMLSGSDLEFFRDAYRFVYDGHPRPDVVVYLRASPDLCLKRVRQRIEDQPQRAFEAGMTMERLARMRRRYEAALDALADDCLVFEVEEGPSPRETADELAELLRAHLQATPSGA
jgi:deoxyadenosine/deoxycytidine kinase